MDSKQPVKDNDNPNTTRAEINFGMGKPLVKKSINDSQCIGLQSKMIFMISIYYSFVLNLNQMAKLEIIVD